MAPDSIHSTGTWVDEIVSAIQACPVMIVVITERSMSSRHVAREVSMALDGDKRVIPLRVTPAELTGALNYLLHLSQWVVAYPGPLEQYADDLGRRLDDTLGADHRDDNASSTTGQLPLTRFQASEVKPRVTWHRNKRTILVACAAILLLILGASIVITSLAGNPIAKGSRNTGIRSRTPTAVPPPQNSSSDDPTTVDAALSAVPSRLDRPADLGTYLPAIARAAGLPQGSPLHLVPRTDSTGSISIRTPNTWISDDGSNPYVDQEKVLGDILVESVDQSRLYKYLGAGLTLSIAVPPRADEKSLVTAFPQNLYISLGCIDSNITAVQRPFPGQVRVWSGCNAPMVFVLGYFAEKAASVDLFCILTTQDEAAVAGAMLKSMHLNIRRVRTYPAGGDKSLP
jgi:hypothetical protein